MHGYILLSALLACLAGSITEAYMLDSTKSQSSVNMKLLGSTTWSTPSGPLILTPGVDYKAGLAYLTDPIDPSGGFTTSFTFTIDQCGLLPADGLAFVLWQPPQQPADLQLGDAGRYMGYRCGDGCNAFGATSNKISVEFDTFLLQSIKVRSGAGANTLLERYEVPYHFSGDVEYMADGDRKYAWIQYDVAIPSNPILKVFYGASNSSKPVKPVISIPINISTSTYGTSKPPRQGILFGFSAGTGELHCRHSINAWSISSVDTTPPSWVESTVPGPGNPVAIEYPANQPSGRVVDFGNMQASDEQPATIYASCNVPTSGYLFPIGTTKVDCTAADKAGNTAYRSFTMKIKDIFKPQFVNTPAGNLLTVVATSAIGANVEYPTIRAKDNIAPFDIIPICNPKSGSFFKVNTSTLVTCTATDAASLVETYQFTVKVLPDVTAPVFTLKPGNITVNATFLANAIVQYTVATDEGIIPVCKPDSGSQFPVGMTQVNCTATDAACNMARYSFYVTVQDVTAPTFTNTPSGNSITVSSTSLDGAIVIFSSLNTTEGFPAKCTPASGSLFHLGTTTVTCYATDKAGNTATYSFTVTVLDKTPPVFINTPKDNKITVYATSNSGAVVSSPDVRTSEGFPIQCTPPFGKMFAMGLTEVRCTAKDQAGNEAVYALTVEVVDVIPPTFTNMPQGNHITVNATSSTGATLVYPAIGTTEGISPICNPASGSTFGVGDTTVTCRATDKANNTATYTFIVTVNDVTPPTFVAMPASNIITANATADGTAVVNFGGLRTTEGVPPICTPKSGSVFSVGSTTVSCTAADKAGNTASYTFTVIVQDVTAPVFSGTPEGDIIVANATSNQGAIVTYPNIGTEEASVAVVCHPASNSMFPIGITKVSCTAPDKAGNTAYYSFVVLVQDVTAPVITAKPDNDVIVANATSSHGATVTYPNIRTEEGSISVVCTPPSGSVFPVGRTTVNCTASDQAGNTATYSFTVLVQDVTAPVIAGKPDNDIIVVNATSNQGAVATYPSIGTDESNVGVVCTPPSDSMFSVGTTRVTCIATDQASNQATYTFNITVQDVTAPVLINKPEDDIIVVNATSSQGATVTYPNIRTEEGSISVVCTPPSGSVFLVGITQVKCTATDQAGNTATYGFSVIVQDTTAPIITARPDNDTIVANATSSQGTIVTYPNITTQEGSVAVVCTPPSGNIFPVGTTQVTCTATDQASNTATYTFNVTVQDVAAPVFTNKPEGDTIVVNASGPGAVVTYPDLSTDDRSATVVCVPPPDSVFPIGITQVTCTATDQAGNTAMYTFSVAVQDKAAPQFILKPANDVIAVNATSPEGALVHYGDLSATDNTQQTVTMKCNKASGSFFSLGTTTVSCNTTDLSGNTAVYIFAVTVRDVFPPVISWVSQEPKDRIMEVNATDAQGSVVVYELVARDASVPGSVMPDCDPKSGSFFYIGTTAVVCVATDAYGNEALYTFIVIVRDMSEAANPGTPGSGDSSPPPAGGNGGSGSTSPPPAGNTSDSDSGSGHVSPPQTEDNSGNGSGNGNGAVSPPPAGGNNGSSNIDISPPPTGGNSGGGISSPPPTGGNSGSGIVSPPPTGGNNTGGSVSNTVPTTPHGNDATNTTITSPSWLPVGNNNVLPVVDSNAANDTVKVEFVENKITGPQDIPAPATASAYSAGPITILTLLFVVFLPHLQQTL